MFAEPVQIGDLYYNLDATNQTAEVVRQIASGEIIIPSSVTYNSVSYSVTSIGKNAFYICTGLTSVTIPGSVTSIGWYAFYMCSGLTSVTCFATTPPQLNTDVFYGVNKSIPLYVPVGSISAYKSANQWKYFTNILPISQQGLEDVQGNNVPCTKIVHNGQIFILLGDKVYNAQGALVK